MDNNEEKIFVNFTNHPSDRWEPKQRVAAETYGKIVDVSFPQVCADADEADIDKLAGLYCQKILEYHPVAVLCQGEFCLAYQVIQMLREQNITVLAACSERDTVEREREDEGIEKTAIFRFVRFRQYT